MNREKQNNLTGGVWLTALLLALLAFLSWGVLSRVMRANALSEPKNVLEISAPSIRLATSSTTAGTGSGSGTGSLASASLSDPGHAENLWVGDDDVGRWGVHRRVNVFRESYINDRGEVTVKSADGERVVAPGTDGVYDFSLKNTGNEPVAYKLHLDTIFDTPYGHVPVRVRLSSGSRWLFKNASTGWLTPEQLVEYDEEGVLYGKHYHNFRFEWVWLFEDENPANIPAVDRMDTTLGNEHAEMADTRFLLNIQVDGASVTEPTPTPRPGSGSGTGTSTAKGGNNVPSTGDARQWLLYGAIMAVGAGGCCWWILTRKRKRDEDEKG